MFFCLLRAKRKFFPLFCVYLFSLMCSLYGESVQYPVEMEAEDLTPKSFLLIEDIKAQLNRLNENLTEDKKNYQEEKNLLKNAENDLVNARGSINSLELELKNLNWNYEEQKRLNQSLLQNYVKLKKINGVLTISVVVVGCMGVVFLILS